MIKNNPFDMIERYMIMDILIVRFHSRMIDNDAGFIAFVVSAAKAGDESALCLVTITIARQLRHGAGNCTSSSPALLDRKWSLASQPQPTGIEEE